MDPLTMIAAARALGPVLAAIPAVRAVFDTAASTLSERDQVALQERLVGLRAENDRLHARLQDKLGTAAGR